MSRIKSRVFAFILTFCMLLTGLYTQDMGVVFAAGEGNGTLTNCTIKIGNPPVPLTNDTVVKNGDSLEIEFNWSLDNNDQTSTEFVVDLGTIKGLQITTGTAENPLKQGSEVVGSYYIADNKLHIVLDKNNRFFGENERTGGVRVNGIVQVNDADLDSNKKTPVGVGSYYIYPTVDTNVLPQATWVNISKGLSGGLTTEGGQLYQTFTANIVAHNGDATNVKLTDTPGSGMSFPENTQITVSGEGVEGLAGTYNGMAALNNALAGKTLVKDKTITLTYTLPVNNSVYQPGASYDVKKNTITVDYTNNKNEQVSNSASTEIQVTDAPSIDKAGKLSADQKSVVWTITVNLGKYANANNLSEVLNYIKDTPGAGLQNAGVISNLDLNQFSNKGNGVFEYTYTTTVDSSLENTTGNFALKNTVEMQMYPNYVYTDIGTVDLPGESWITKTAHTQPDENGYIVWDVTITPPADVTKVVLKDTLQNAHEQYFIEGVYINDILVRTVVGELYNGSGTYTAAAKGILQQPDGSSLNGGEPCYNIDMYFTDDFIAKNNGQAIKITYKSKIYNELQDEFTNRARVDYVCPIIGSTYHESPIAVYVDKNSKLALEKQVNSVQKNVVEYKVAADYTKCYDLKLGDVVTIKDTLPKGMTWDASSCVAQAGYGLEGWYQIPSNKYNVQISEEGERQEITFTFTLYEELFNALNFGNNDKPMIAVGFKAELTDKDELQALYEAGKKTYVNDASATVGNLTATASAPAELTAPSVVDKYGLYDMYTAPDCFFEVEINKECLDLVDGDTLMGVDTMGELLNYNPKASLEEKTGLVNVYKNTPAGWVLMTAGTDYFFTYSEKDGKKQMIFTGLPDATHLKITYAARVEQLEDSIREGAASNTFELKGIKNEDAGEAETVITTAVESSGWADSEFYDITLNKYWTDGSNQMRPLNGAEFKVVKMKINETTGLLEEDGVLHENIKVESSGETLISKLTVQNIYALYETKAPIGYEAKSEPYYFVLQSSSVDLSKVSSNITVHRFTAGSSIWYDNEPAYGTLEIKKTITGIDAADVDPDKISFTISPRVGNKDTYTLSEFTKGNDGTYSKVFTNVPVAEYKVTENRIDITGYTFTTMEYAVKSENSSTISGTESAGTSGTEMAATVEKEVTTVVEVENTYTKEMVTISGNKVWDDENDQDGKRPSSITIHLFANGVEKASKTVSATDNWEWTFGTLPKYENGALVTYSITETAVAEYTPEITKTETGNSHTYVITNSYKPGVTAVSVTKAWDDNNNQDGKRPESVVVQLLANGVVKEEAEVKASDNWTYTWTNLDLMADGNAVVYTVKEKEVPNGYGSTPEITGTAANGYVITNTHTPSTVTIGGTKDWVDNSNQDGMRPASITLRLYADGVEVDSMTVNATNNWAWNFGVYPEYKDGTPIVYTVKEDTVAGYTTTITGDVANGFAITNTHDTAEVSVSVNKVWEDADNQDGKRPTYVLVQLYADDVEEGSAVYLSSANLWKNTWKGLPKFKDGKIIVYTVKEESVVEGYTVNITGSMESGFTITNTYTPETVIVSGGKTWSDNKNQDGKRPDSITVNLLADDVLIESKSVTAQDDWKWSFDNLPKYKEGKLITYTITEETVTGYTTKVNGYNIANSYTPEQTSVSVRKVWDDENNQDGKRPASVEVQLWAGNTQIGANVVLDATNQWNNTWSGLPKYANGQLIQYTVKEVTNIIGYTTSVTGTQETGYVITNSYTPETITVSGKKTWSDNSNQDGKRPASITVKLLANGSEVQRKIVSATDNWAWSFDNLPKYEAGQEISYTISEEAVDGYQAEVNGYDITNRYTPELTSVSVQKVWDDEKNRDGKRPASIQVQLYADGNAMGAPITLDETNDWKYTWKDLDKNAAGNVIAYTVDEVSVPNGYSKSVTGTTNSFTITNSYVPEVTSVSVEKVWEDSNNQDGIRPTAIQVQLYADGDTVGEAITLNEANGWKYTWSNLKKNAAGKEIKYTVNEVSIPTGYTKDIRENATNDYTIINSHIVGTTSVSVKKVWDDTDNQDGLRPTSIQVQLYADGNAEGTAVILNETNGWTCTWSNLALKSGGKDIVYTVDEATVPAGYEKSITGDAATGFEIKNSHTPLKTTITVEKIWTDGNNQDGKRPTEITVQLYENGNPKGQSVVLNASNGWKYTWSELPVKKSGQEIVYAVDELVVPAGYEKSVSSLTNGKVNITNRHTPEVITISGSKSWVDENNKDNSRPESITIRLYKGDTLVLSKVVKESDNWSWEFTQLPKYENGVEIVYSIKEDAVENYTTEISGYDVVNTYVKPDKPGDPDGPSGPDDPSDPNAPSDPDDPSDPVVPTPTPGPGDVTPTPTPGPGDVTPTPTPGPGDVTPTPTPGPGDVTPTPTPGPVVPTPTPTPAPSNPTPAPTPAPTPVPTPVPTEKPIITVPKTADEAPIAVWVSLMAIGLGGMVAVIACARKRKNKRER